MTLSNKKPLLILFFTLLLDTISIGILIPILPVILTDPTSPTFILQGYSVGMQYFIAGAIIAVFGFMQFLASPILGELSDVYGRKKLLTMGVALLALSNLVFGFGIEILSLSLLFVSRIVAGLAGANFSIAQASIADVSEPKDRAKNFGLIGAAFGIGFILGPLLGGWIAASFNHAAAPFWFAGSLGVLNVIFITLFLPETRRVSKAEMSRFDVWKGFHNIRDAFHDVDAGPVYLTSFLYMSGFAFFTTFISILLSVKYGFSEADVGTFFGLVGLFIALTQVFVIRMIGNRWSEKRIMVIGFPIVALTIVLYPFAGSAPFLYALIPIMAIPQGLAFANLTALISKSVSAEKQGAALGINASVMALTQGIIPLVAGVATSFIGLTSPFVAGALLIMCAWLVIKRSAKRDRA